MTSLGSSLTAPLIFNLLSFQSLTVRTSMIDVSGTPSLTLTSSLVIRGTAASPAEATATHRAAMAVIKTNRKNHRFIMFRPPFRFFVQTVRCHNKVYQENDESPATRDCSHIARWNVRQSC